MKWSQLGVLAALAVPAVYADAQPAGRVTGTVVDAAGGTPGPGVNVTVVATSFGGSTGADGRVAIRGVADGSVQIRAQRIGFAPVTQTVTVRNGLADAVTFRLSPQAVV